MAPDKICREFARRGKCKFKNCKFVHDDNAVYHDPAEPHKRNKELSNSEREFRAWRDNIPRMKDIMTVRPLHGRLGFFFQEARRLIEVDAGMLQNVIQSLASEGGLRRVRELLEQDFATMNPSMKENVFKDQLLPFLELACHANVVSSLVLEQAVGTLYNFMYGHEGTRGSKLLSYVADILAAGGKDEPSVCRYEVSVHVFSRIVDLNSTALVQESLKVQAKRFEQVFIFLHSSEVGNLLHHSRTHLERLLRRLEIGSSLPSASPQNPSNAARPGSAFVVHREPPGGRHNNDHPDICRIRVMPSFQEITASRTEYLPVNDPSQWHLGGADGLLDRNFRLLREDTIGQLRDAIHREVRKSHLAKSLKTQQQRTFVYHDARIAQLHFDKMSGLHFEVTFPQPTSIRGLPIRDVEAWWQLSKRLQSGGLVCLIFKGNFVLFSTVMDQTWPHAARPREDKNDRQKLEPGLLWRKNTHASVLLELVDRRETNIQAMLNQYSITSSSFAFVEFPGVMLPAFEPTLRALQAMKRSENLPFVDLLVPSNNVSTDVPPPPYALKPGFQFNLRCLMNDNSDFYVRTGQPVDLQRLQENSSLDDAQAAALVNTLQRKIGLIQGPPGTGKSYTGIALIKVLLANQKQGKSNLGPIICVTYTNHALDQLLEGLLDKDVTSQIVRIGSRSKSERLGEYNMRHLARNIERTKMEKSGQWSGHRQLEEFEKEFEKEFDDIGLREDISASRMKSHLQEVYPQHYRQLFGQDNDGFQVVHGDNPQVAFNDWLRNGQATHGATRPPEQLKQQDLLSLSQQERRALYRCWVNEIIVEMHEKLIQLCSSHNISKTEFDNIRNEVDLRCLNEAHVIGLTTSGLARNLNMLRRLQSKVILCEEAGEVLEAHLLTALLPSVEHAILIGDHLQLRPQVQNYDLSRENHRGGEKYSLDVSLFERLVDSNGPMGSGLPFSTLETQRRMHPSISQLVSDTLYPQLKDAPSVSEYPEVFGIKKRLFWVDHRMPEGNASNTDAMSTSHWNQHEIDMTTALVNHLIRQGRYQSGDIAVLTPYLGQLHRLRQRLGLSFAITVGERDQDELDKAGFEEDAANPTIRTTLLQTLRVATVDNFQGEEAKVVVISLVRSNLQNRCGFLRTSNRINVLMSRAQHGMYIIGNSETSSHVAMWAHVLQILKENGNIGDALELQCPRHPDTPISVSEPDDFTRVSPEGGCNLRCVNRLSCGHACIQKCHSEVLHNAVHCLEPCPRPRKGCAHPCPKRCGDICPTRCTVNVFQKNRALACGHLMPNLPCWQDQDTSLVRCGVLVKKEVPGCRHQVSVACHVDVTSADYQCSAQCRAVVPCGHTCKKYCFGCKLRNEAGDVQFDHGTCKQKCGRNQSTCAHVCTTPCHGETPCPPCQAGCNVQCGHSRCMRKCSEPCTPCAEERCLSSCPHSQCTMPCAAPCNHVPCSLRCEKTLECGHRCPSVCGEDCPSRTYCQECGSDEIKDREVDFILGESYKEIKLDDNPCIFPKCGHFLTMESMDGQMSLNQHYDTDAEGKPVAIKTASQPFSMDDIKTCATCRGSLRDISRYGRLIRRAILDESTKKLILYLNNEYVPLAQNIPLHIKHLQDTEIERLKEWPDTIQIHGSRNRQILVMQTIVKRATGDRWKGVLNLRNKVVDYLKRVGPEEQPFIKVRDMVENARRRNKTTETFVFDDNVLQTKGLLQATSLILRLDIALLADFLTMKKHSPSNVTSGKLELDLAESRKECLSLIHGAARSSRILQQAEGYLFMAQLHALERSHSNAPAVAEEHLSSGRTALEHARSFCSLYPGQTQGLLDEVDGAEKMLNGSTFYAAVTNEERMAVIQAMAREFRGTGHWYYCRNGHPFTIGECGGAMQIATCPECGAPVGGQHHNTVEGVTRADDLEGSLAGMSLH